MMANEDLGRQLLQCTVRIDTKTKDGHVRGGTGFITSYTHGNKSGQFLVTNRHVVADATRLRLEFLAEHSDKESDVAKKISIEIPDVQRGLVFHKDPQVDIAVMPFSAIPMKYSKKGMTLRYKVIPPDIYLTRSKSKTIHAIEEVVVVGYPRLLRDEHTLTPIVRKGITATPLDQDFQAYRGFLIDAAIFEGSSGSPVFIYNTGAYSTPNGIVLGRRLIFLGILASLVSGQKSFPGVGRKGVGAAIIPDGASGSDDVPHVHTQR